MKKALAIVLCLLLLLPSMLIPVFAYNTFNDHVLIGGVGNSGYNTRYYWISSSASVYTSLTNAAMYSWNHTAVTPGVTTPIWFQQVNSQSSSVMDVYVSSTPHTYLAQTIFYPNNYDHNTTIDPYNGNWRWCEIVIYSSTFQSHGDKQGTIAHEIGHVMGLAHNNADQGSIMCQSGAGRTVNSPSADDCNGINHLY